MSSTTQISFSNHRLILDALDDYARQTGIDLTKNPFIDQFQNCVSPRAILDLLEERAMAFKDYRDGNRNLIKWLSPVVQVLHVFAGVLGPATSLVFKPANAIVCGVDILLVTAIEVRASYDALVDLFECVANFLQRLQIYTEVPFNAAMTDIIVKILVEVLSVLALATKQIKQGLLKKFAKKLLGEKEIEAVLQRLDRLTLDEARMTVAQTFEVVHGLVNNVKVVMDDGKASTSHMQQALGSLLTSYDARDDNRDKQDETSVPCNQLQRDIRIWLSPPDPSTNHNIARTAHHDGTAAWFIQGDTFQKWKIRGSLLWIHGKPGSGKSVLCSSIIQDAKAKFDSGSALLGYFYFDFRDILKQDVHGLLTSLLAQLSAKSDPCNNALSQLYSQHNAGSHQPDDQALTECLKEILRLQGLPDVYIIVDGLDECPNTSGFPTARERVLDLVDELVQLNLPNLRICVTSRPETDIRTVLEPLTSLRVSLHDERGQGQDILDYVSTVVYSDRRMRKWRTEDKQHVIDVLFARSDGMFRWVFCQLDTLRRSFPAAIRRTLDELPETLDATYERTLLGIEKEKREYAHRLFQCLLVAVRPLRVEELANVLAIRFDVHELPQYCEDWCPVDAQDAVLSACSSLIVILNVDESPIIQFSHFSVREFLTSDRLAKAGKNLSRYHVALQSAHTMLAQASLSILLHLDDHVDKQRMTKFPFANYAARHWVDHGRFKNVVRNMDIQHAMERLFDRDKPHFRTWVWIYDIDLPLRQHMFATHPTPPLATPLYYATLCGFRSLVVLPRLVGR
ncbi:hypothetical protein BGW80DRAFT_1447974 [Lactifluus volemus]|nr:hypothetical protein BGW80DRAFT_1447974 [Lactifluus volemus]